MKASELENDQVIPFPTPGDGPYVWRWNDGTFLTEGIERKLVKRDCPTELTIYVRERHGNMGYPVKLQDVKEGPPE